jgi:hypothetical protein
MQFPHKALDTLVSDLLSLGKMASDMTGSGTYMEVMVKRIPGATKLSPEAQSIPNNAPM